MSDTVELTVAQATVRFLAAQYSEWDGVKQRLFAGCLGIFGHGNVAGVGQALLEAGDDMPYVLARNEQAMVHAASGYARQKNRLSTWACTASVGPGSTNMVTGASLATINRLPVLLLPGDISASARFYDRDIVTEPAVLDDGHVRVPTGPGLGIEIDAAALEAFTVRRERITR